MNIQLSKNIANRILKILDIEVQANDIEKGKRSEGGYGEEYFNELVKLQKHLRSKLK